jgi:hypothetical protein
MFTLLLILLPTPTKWGNNNSPQVVWSLVEETHRK